METDNNFPPDKVDSSNVIEGSGAGALEEPVDVTSTTEFSGPPPLEEVQLPISDDILPTAGETEEDSSCPKPCVCHVEGESNDFVVDCSGYGLVEFPASIDSKTTTLNIQNNKITEIPKDISALKNLQVFNAESNSIMDLASGVSMCLLFLSFFILFLSHPSGTGCDVLISVKKVKEKYSWT